MTDDVFDHALYATAQNWGDHRPWEAPATVRPQMMDLGGRSQSHGPMANLAGRLGPQKPKGSWQDQEPF